MRSTHDRGGAAACAAPTSLSHFLRGAVSAGGLLLTGADRRSLLDVYDLWSEERDCSCVAKALRPDHQADATARRKLRKEVPDVGFLGIHLCSALHWLHRHGYLHLDLKPSNIVSDCGQPKGIDLSIARPPGRARGAGTRVYMAPEQVGELPTPATDVWGIGAVLYEAATGRRPLAEPASHCEHPPLERQAEPILSHRCLPRALARAIDSCLKSDPADRLTIGELAAVLESVVEP